MVSFKLPLEYFWISWIAIGLLIHVEDAVFRGQCYREGTFGTMQENRRLNNYILCTRDVHLLMDCTLACEEQQQCRSFNFQVSGNPLHTCELNGRTQLSARPGSLELVTGYQYYEAIDNQQESCDSSYCYNNGTCGEQCDNDYPYLRCRCLNGFSGLYCEKMETGKFLLKYSSSNIEEYSRVVIGKSDFSYMSSCVWFKPLTPEGIVFTYATNDNPVEMALLFNRSGFYVHMSNAVVTVNISIGVNKWSHVCFSFFKGAFSLYFNGLRVLPATNITEKTVIKGGGYIVPAFKQIAPGKRDHNSSSNVLLSRLYFWNNKVYETDVFRMFYLPHVSVSLFKTPLVHWTSFYRPQLTFSTTVVYPTEDPQEGYFDLRFSGHQQPVIIGLTTPGLREFTLCMWLKTTQRVPSTNRSALFALKSGNKTVIELFTWDEQQYLLVLENSGWSFDGCRHNGRWCHLCLVWASGSGSIYIYVDGSQLASKYQVKRNEALPEVIQGTVSLGNQEFVGEMSNVNVWSTAICYSCISCLRFQPGPALSDVFTWTTVAEKDDLENSRMILPSKVFKEADEHFDLNFPIPAPNTINYIYLRSPQSNAITTLSVSFWIKIPVVSSPFTLISYAVPSQINEFNVHFGTNGIWIHLHGIKRFVSLERQNIVENWHFFFIQWKKSKKSLRVHHNGDEIYKETRINLASIQTNGGVLVVGAQQSGCDIVTKEYQFIGQLSQLQFWYQSFAHGVIRLLSARCSSIPGNLFRWFDMLDGIEGTVLVKDTSECLKINDGEERFVG